MNSVVLQTLKNSLLRFAPPPQLLVSEWADAKRHLSPESSAEPGRWFTSRAEYQRGMMDALCDPSIDIIVIQSSAQIGKTEIINNIVGYYIDQDPSPMLIVQPTVDMGMAWSKDRLAPMLRDTPCLKGKVSDPRSRDSGNTTMHKIFPGGHITIAGSNSPSGLASRPIRVVLADEVDRWPASAGSEGDPLRLAFKRTSTFWNRKRVVVSTPTVKGFSRIEAMMEESDKRRYWVPCPHCGEYQNLQWSQVQWPDGHPEQAMYYCEHCGVEITDADKLAMIRNGEWRAECESRGVAGFYLNELYSPWRSFADVACDFIEAKKSPETLRVWVNTSLGESWEDSGEQVEGGPLYHRRERFDGVPEWAGLITAGVDVQGDRLEVTFIAWGKDEECAVLAHRQIFGDPASLAVWNELDITLQHKFSHPLYGYLGVTSACIDSGGHHTNEVYNFTRPRSTRRIFAIKGIAGEGRAFVSRPTTSNQGKVPLFGLGVDTGKDTLYARLKINEPGAGYIHFSHDLDEEYFHQLTAEKINTKYIKGHPHREWIKKRARNEALDCFIYGMAAFRILNVNINNHIDRLAPITEQRQPRKMFTQSKGVTI